MSNRPPSSASAGVLAPPSLPWRLSSCLVMLLLSIAAIVDASVLSFGGDGAAAEDLQVVPPSPDAAATTAAAGSSRPLNSMGQETYGLDVSFAIQHREISTNYAWLPHNVDPENIPVPREYRGMAVQPLGDKRAEYKARIEGCKQRYPGTVCESTERARLNMSLRQPKSMQNYTDLGFKKIRAPPDVWDKIQQFWKDNKDKENWNPEKWSKGNTYTNHWDSPTYMVSVENARLRGAGARLKKAVWSAARETMQEWTGEEVTASSMYGIRVYTEGAVLATHVDRMPLVTSAIINVDQDTDEPWPIEVYAHDGKAYNVTMEPGDMVLYESHTVLHGRPFPLKGRFYANIFVHFEPTGHSLRHNAKEAADKVAAKDHHERYTKDAKEGRGGHENAIDGIPPYILHGSEEEEMWKRKHPAGSSKEKNDSSSTGSTRAHRAAMLGDADELSKVIDKLGHLLDARDVNGWTPLHEGSRAGHKEVVELLLKKGADVNGRTGSGGSALYYSVKNHGENHPVSMLLQNYGGINIGPDL